MSGEPRPIVGSAIYANLVAKKQRIESSSYKKVFAVKKKLGSGFVSQFIQVL